MGSVRQWDHRTLSLRRNYMTQSPSISVGTVFDLSFSTYAHVAYVREYSSLHDIVF